MEEIKVYQLNDCEWYATKGDLEDLINWYRDNIDDSETYEEMLEEAEECDLDNEGMFWQTEDEEDLKRIGTADELINKDENNNLQLGSLMKFGNEIFKYIPFRQAIEYDLDFKEPYCIASTEF